jgi:Tfp pilus assembly protein PilV
MLKSVKKNRCFGNKAGQTLIETLAAAFILTMGMTAATGLAIYAFNSSGSIVRQIIATGLAREGLEAVRNMRDTNWLKDTLTVNGCYNFATAQSSKANCYPNWLGNGVTPYCINPTINNTNCNGDAGVNTSINYYLGFDATQTNFWSLTKDQGNALKFGLNFNDPSAGTTWQTQGFYSPGSGVTCTNSNSGYCREIILTKLTPSGTPYDPANSGGSSQTPGPLLEVQSKVWWVDKKCPKVDDFNNASISCKVELDTYLTNWKSF